jgi:hypothetical protein
MATDNTSLANRALRLLKATTITSLTDGTKNANVMNNIFALTREELIRSHTWNFATKLTTLSRSGTTPSFEFDYGYVLPSDWKRTLAVHDNDAGEGTIHYREAELAGEGVILASVETLYLKYIYDVTDPNRMPADFQTALVYALAVGAPGIGNISAQREAELVDRAAQKLRIAKSADAMGSRPESRPIGSWATVRGGWRANRDWW